MESLERMPEQFLEEQIQALLDDEIPRVPEAFNDFPERSAPTSSRSTTKLSAAIKRVKRLLQKRSPLHWSSADNTTKPGLESAAWASLGPESIGGRTRSLVIDPRNSSRMWAGSLGGGVWRTDDAGKHYYPIADELPNLTVSCMVLDPTSPGSLYVGTGEDFFLSTEGLQGSGIFKIDEHGKPRLVKGTDRPDFTFIRHLAISSDGRVLLAATSAGLLRVSDPTSGKWERSSELNFGVGTVLFDSRDNRNVVAGGLSGGEVFYSVNGGEHWIASLHPGASWSGRVELTYARANSALVYASVGNTKDDGGVEVNGEIWRSFDGGKTYSRMKSFNKNTCPDCKKADYLGQQSKYSNTIWAGDPIRPDLVIVGGLELWRSEDGGDTLSQITSYYDRRSAHADHHFIVADPGFDGSSNNRALFCNDGGIFQTDDVHTVGNDTDHICGWKSLNQTYATVQFHGAAGNSTMRMVLGGTQDNGTQRFLLDGAADNWTEVAPGTGDGGFCGFDSSARLIFGSGALLKLFRISEALDHPYNIVQRLDLTTNTACENVISDVGVRNRANFVAPFLVDPNVEGRILAGGISLWRTNNSREPVSACSGPSWQVIKESTEDSSPISSIAIVPGNSNVIWVGHNNGEVFKTDAGAGADPRSTWQKMVGSGPNELPDRPCTRIVLDPRNPAIVYATFGGYSGGNIWRSADGGRSWNSISGAMPPLPVLSFAIHPQNTRYLFAGTALGMYVSDSERMDWRPIGPVNSPVTELFWIDQTLFAATYGRGMYKIDVPSH